MTDTLTLSQLRTRVRERADMVSSSFVTDSELNGYIDYSYKELYDLLVDANEDYNLSSTTFSIVSGNTQALPSDFYKLRGVDDLTDAARPITVKKFQWNERNLYSSTVAILSYTGVSDVYYRVAGSNLIFEPESNAQKTFKLWYVPRPATLSADGDLADGVSGWLEYVIIDAAIKCLMKEESDVRAHLASKAAITERISKLRHNRDQALPERISRVENRPRWAREYDGEW